MTKAKSRTSTRRRAPMQKRKAKKLSPYASTWHHAKCTMAIPVEHMSNLAGTDPTAARFVVKWDDTTEANSDTPYTLTLMRTREYRAYRGVYREVTVVGCKIHYEGYKAIGGDKEYRTARAWSNTSLFQGPTEVGPVAAAFWDTEKARQTPDYREYKGNPNFTKYIGVQKFHKKRGLPMIKQTSSNIPTSHCTAFELNTVGFPDDHDMGRVTVTWYVIFKQPHLNYI